MKVNGQTKVLAAATFGLLFLGQFAGVVWIVAKNADDIPEIKQDLKEIKADVKTFSAHVTSDEVEMSDLERRIEKLEQ